MFALDTPKLRYTLLLFLWLDYFWEQYLRARQFKKIVITIDPPCELEATMSKTFDKTRIYTLQRKKLHFAKDFISIIVTTIVIHFQVLPKLWHQTEAMRNVDETARSCIWYFIYTTFLSILNLPVTIYDIFVVESAWKNSDLLAWEKMKNFVWSQIFIVLICSFLVALVNKGDEFFVSVWFIFCIIVFLVGITYPQMAPSRFRRLTLLKPCDLKTQLIDLAASFNFPLSEIFVEERLKRNSTHYVYFFGPPKQKSIVLFDTLFGKEDSARAWTHDEILAMVSLELARWYHKHALKYVLALEVNLVFSFASFFLLFKNSEVFKIFGFERDQPVLIGVYVVLKYVMVPCTTLFGFLFMYVTRSFVMEDDKFVVKLGRGEALIRALVRMEKKTEFPVYDHLYSVWHHDKPCLMDRIEAIREASEGKFD